MRSGDFRFIPGEPDWLHLEGDLEVVRVFFVYSAKPLAALDQLCDGLRRAGSEEERSELARRLLTRIESISASPGGPEILRAVTLRRAL
ncbi:MAG: hypothetical protein V2A76_03120 [Planctomycetota bacterium]